MRRVLSVPAMTSYYLFSVFKSTIEFPAKYEILRGWEDF